MLHVITLYITALIVLAITFIGCFYLIAPERISGSFGLKPPASDLDTRAWLRLKGVRDLASGMVVLTLLLVAGRHPAGLALLAFALIPLGDMSIVLASGGSKSAAFSIHGLTCATMLVVGFLLFHGS